MIRIFVTLLLSIFAFLVKAQEYTLNDKIRVQMGKTQRLSLNQAATLKKMIGDDSQIATSNDQSKFYFKHNEILIYLKVNDAAISKKSMLELEGFVEGGKNNSKKISVLKNVNGNEVLLRLITLKEFSKIWFTYNDTENNKSIWGDILFKSKDKLSAQKLTDELIKSIKIIK